MGHHSVNLIDIPELSKFKGAILSPLNYSEDEIRLQVERMAENDKFEILFDPQLYYPKTDRIKLKEWSYFPNDVDTADMSSITWWNQLVHI